MRMSVELAEFEDEDGASSSDMDEYDSEDELGDMGCSPRSQNKKPQSAQTSAAGKSKAKPRKTAPTASSKPQPAKPPVPSKPPKSSVTKPSASIGATDRAKPSPAMRSDDIGSFLGMREYMDAMDRELTRTTIGKSFVREGDEVAHDFFTYSVSAFHIPVFFLCLISFL